MTVEHESTPDEARLKAAYVGPPGRGPRQRLPEHDGRRTLRPRQERQDRRRHGRDRRGIRVRRGVEVRDPVVRRLRRELRYAVEVDEISGISGGTDAALATSLLRTLTHDPAIRSSCGSPSTTPTARPGDRQGQTSAVLNSAGFHRTWSVPDTVDLARPRSPTSSHGANTSHPLPYPARRRRERVWPGPNLRRLRRPMRRPHRRRIPNPRRGPHLDHAPRDRRTRHQTRTQQTRRNRTHRGRRHRTPRPRWWIPPSTAATASTTHGAPVRTGPHRDDVASSPPLLNGNDEHDGEGRARR